MKFLHLADLHFGKSIYGVSLLEKGDQPVWVERFLQLVCEIQPDAIVIAGDVYDRSSPSGEAVALLDSMITDLAEKGGTGQFLADAVYFSKSCGAKAGGREYSGL